MSWDARAGKAAEPVWLHQRITPERNPLKHVEALATPVRYSRGQAIYEEDSAVDCWCRVVSGVAKRFSLRIDGRRQIVDLLLANDVFGFGSRGRHRCSAEAVVDGTVIARYTRARLESLASSDVRVAQQLQEALTDAMTRLQTQILTLGRTTAEAKVGCFLLSMAGRLSANPTDAVLLPISREDIADYLALSVETVSRSLTQLKRRGVIRFLGTRRIKIVDREAIEEADRFTPIGDKRSSDGWLDGPSELVRPSFAKYHR
jgi:CRP/FNR family transcriptional regulator, nitrogen fixation regulation protein